ncbi:MAG: ATP-dependent DNA helicase [Lachnospiraceae bacterium]|nr:ATP-dependent DNA helicase [Lachnospiraceae bacterium]
MEEIRISVRGLVEFVLREGDIDNRGRGDIRQAMLEGARIHRMIQKREGAGYQAEVPLAASVPMEDYVLVVEGRADGIIDTDTRELTDGQMSLADYLNDGAERDDEEESRWTAAPVIDEIKGTYAEIDRLREPKVLHLAQAKVYAHLFALREGLDRVKVRLTYCNMETEEIRYFRSRFRAEELRRFFDDLIARYRRFSDYLFYERRAKLSSIRALEFPYAYRSGQKTLAGYVYRTIAGERKLFLEAPTGAGKTLAVLYPALKAIGEGRADRLFYMTAKTIARTAPEQALELLRSRGLVFRAVSLTAKERSCVLERPDCNPAVCSRARGHFSRVNDAIYALLSEEESFDRQAVARVAARFTVCPFELSLDLALFADGVICDYNYVFDPFVYLRRFFAEGKSGAHLFLVDEAHNLLDRGRDMYSAQLTQGEIADARDCFDRYAADHAIDPKERKKLAGRFDRSLQALLAIGPERGEKLALLSDIDALLKEWAGLQGQISEWMGEENSAFEEEELNFYFRLFRFMTIADYLDDHYLIYTDRLQTDGIRLKLFCVDPSERLGACMERAVSTILFSATFLPVQYYKSLLGGEPEDYEAYAETSFSPDQFRVLFARDVTSRYQARGEEQYRRAARYLAAAVDAKQGNYLAFFPSYRMMREVCRVFAEEFHDPDKVRVVVQQEQMTEAGREAFLSWFTAGTETDLSQSVHMEIEVAPERSTLGFCVLGGIFGEGIDLKGERLIGVIVVGTGLPQISEEQELLRDYFEQRGRDGFDYAYRFPGMNRVLQAAGRVIRTEQDVGVMLLLDDRFLQTSYRQLFPKEWKDCKIVTTESVKNELNAFWKRADVE